MAGRPDTKPRSTVIPHWKTLRWRSIEMKSFAQPKFVPLEIGLASRLLRGSQQIHCQYTPRPHRSVTNPVP